MNYLQSVNHVRSTYRNCNSIAVVYRIMSCRLSSQCRLSTIFSFFSRQLQQQNLLWAPVASYAVSKPGSKFTLWSHAATPTKCPGNRWTLATPWHDAPLDSIVTRCEQGFCRGDGREGQPRRILTWGAVCIQTLWTKSVPWKDEGVG